MPTNALTFYRDESLVHLLRMAQANAEDAAIRYTIRVIAFNASDALPVESSIDDIKCENFMSEALQIEQAAILRGYVKACDTPNARAVLMQTAEAVLVAVSSKKPVSTLPEQELAHV